MQAGFDRSLAPYNCFAQTTACVIAALRTGGATPPPALPSNECGIPAPRGEQWAVTDSTGREVYATHLGRKPPWSWLGIPPLLPIVWVLAVAPRLPLGNLIVVTPAKDEKHRQRSEEFSHWPSSRPRRQPKSYKRKDKRTGAPNQRTSENPRAFGAPGSTTAPNTMGGLAEALAGVVVCVVANRQWKKPLAF